jgi:choice-of-anchor A domain-containing protein
MPAVAAAAAAVATCVVLALRVVSPADAATPEEVLSPCIGPDCPVSYPDPNNLAWAGRDAAVNVFVGGDFRVRENAAESEGRIVVMGDLDVDKSAANPRYDMGVVGVGSRVVPPNDSDFVTIGGAATVAQANMVGIGGVDLTATPAWGNVVHAGALDPARFDVLDPGEILQDADATAAYDDIAATIPDLSDCLAEQATTGTVEVTASEATFTGDGSSALQVFEVDEDLGTANSGIGFTFADIPADATVIVNLLGDSRLVNTFTGGGGGPVDALRTRLLWNAPTTTSLTFTGFPQFQGSILAGNAGGTTNIDTPGVNGRIALAGDLVHSGDGAELHNYPFNGQLPNCLPTTPPTTEPPTTFPTTPPTTTQPSPGIMTHTPTDEPMSATAGPGGSDQDGSIPGVGASPGLFAALVSGIVLVVGGTALVAVALRRRGEAEGGE